MAEVTNQMIVELRFNYKTQGWSETFNFKEAVATYSAAVTAATALVLKRKAILPDTASIVRCRVSFLGRPREAKLVQLSYPIAGIAGTVLSGYTVAGTAPNDVQTALHVRFETATGRYVNEYVRCLPDDKVTAQAMGTAVPIITEPISDDPIETWTDRLADYLYHIKANFAYKRVLNPGTATEPPTVDQQAFDAYIPVGMSSKKTGSSFSKPRGRRPVGS